MWLGCSEANNPLKEYVIPKIPIYPDTSQSSKKELQIISSQSVFPKRMNKNSKDFCVEVASNIDGNKMIESVKNRKLSDSKSYFEKRFSMYQTQIE